MASPYWFMVVRADVRIVLWLELLGADISRYKCPTCPPPINTSLGGAVGGRLRELTRKHAHYYPLPLPAGRDWGINRDYRGMANLLLLFGLRLPFIFKFTRACCRHKCNYKGGWQSYRTPIASAETNSFHSDKMTPILFHLAPFAHPGPKRLAESSIRVSYYLF